MGGFFSFFEENNNNINSRLFCLTNFKMRELIIIKFLNCLELSKDIKVHQSRN